ncbi:MAG: SDR family oxidoreductase [Candidatus Saganbacteria bacterium]|nr:SDR family oxidoreductase [Candidatus Saganbacteria bacterium]
MGSLSVMLPKGLARFNLSGKTAVVIGGTGALGGAIAQGLGEAGARIAVLGRDNTRGDLRVRSIQEQGGAAAFFKADALDRLSLVDAQGMIVKRFGQPDILVNAAGGNKPGAVLKADLPFGNLALHDWAEVFNLNLVGGVFYPCQVFGTAMANQGRGSIINIASVAAHLPLTNVIAYSSSKAAVLNLSQFLSTVWATKGVRVNTITPGFFPAEQNRKLLFEDDGSPKPRAKAIWSHTPMGRFGKPEELMTAAIFLASDFSSFTTGSDIRVDGGFLSMTI